MSYKVYKRVVPDGRVYIGCTNLSLEARAGVQGARYQTCPRFYKAILEFGWERIKSEVLAEVDDLGVARELEEHYIAEYDATNPDKGFNCAKTSGLASSPLTRAYVAQRTAESMTTEVRARMSQSIRNSERFQQAVHSEAHRQKCSESARRRFASSAERTEVGRAVRTSKEYQAAISRPGYQEQRLEKVNSSEARAKRSAAIKGRIHIHRGTEGKMIHLDQLPEYEASGWVRGRVIRNSK